MADNIDFALNDHFYDFVDDWNYKFYFLVGGYMEKFKLSCSRKTD